MFRRTALGAAAVLTTGLMALGCGDDGDTILGSVVPSAFPGTPVAQNDTASDLRAFSPAGIDFFTADTVKVWHNSSSRAVVLTMVDDTNGELWVSYSSGDGRFTPLRQIRVDRSSDNDPVVEAVVFLNTSGFDNGNSGESGIARGRNNDVVLLFRQEVGADPSTASSNNDNDTVGLHSTYFKSSLASTESTFLLDAGSGVTKEFQHGWMVEAVRVDSDPDASVAAGGSFNVTGAGVVTDSADGSHAGTPDSTGQATTLLYAIWNQVPSDTVASRLHQRRFPLTTADHYSFSSTIGQITYSGLDNAEASPFDFSIHNGLMFWEVTGIENGAEGAGTGNDDGLGVVLFTETAVSSVTLLGNRDENGTGIDVEIVPDNHYGPDHDLSTHYLVYTEAGFDGNADNTAGNQNPDADLYLATVEVSGTTITANTAQIDGFVTEAATPTAAAVGGLGTQINQNGTYILAHYTQRSSDSGDTATVNATEDLKVVAIRTDVAIGGTNPPFSAPLTLNDSSTATSGALQSNGPGGTGGAVVSQQELGNGSTGSLYRCGIQSNPNRMNFAFVELDSLGSDPVVELHLAGVTVGLPANDGTPTLNDEGDQLVASADGDWAGSLSDVTVYDNGNDGAAGVAFGMQANDTADEDDNDSEWGEKRVFTSIDGASVNLDTTTSQISTDGTFDEQQLVPGTLVVVTAPRSMSRNSNGFHSGTITHFFWEETRQGVGSETMLMHRALDKASGNFSPIFPITNDEPVDLLDSEVALNGDVVEVFFCQGDRLFWRSGNPNSGWGEAQVIDNTHGETVGSHQFATDSNGTDTSCDDAPGTVVLYSKTLDDTSNESFNSNERLHLRVRSR